jgi:protein phosphatase
MEIWGKTDKGRVRQITQDVFMTLTCEPLGVAVLVVCDGMGGARSGEVASASAAERFIELMRAALDGADGGGGGLASSMADAVTAAGEEVYTRSVTDPDCAGMGTTLVAAAVTPRGEVVVNVGDSRAYHIAGGAIRQVTKDHSVVEDMVDRGDITRYEARNHPNKNLITRALGTSDREEPDVFPLSMAPGDYLLLCSDGLSNLVPEEELLRETRRGESVSEICEVLVNLALSRGAPDNVTAVLYRK